MSTTSQQIDPEASATTRPSDDAVESQHADDDERASDDDAGEPEPEALPKDDLFHILQTARRRQVLRYVLNREGPFRMRDVAEQVAAWEHDTTVRQLTSKQRQRVYIALYQSHLPKLDDAGLIAYQQKRGIVETTPLTETVIPHIDGVATDATDAAADDAEPAGDESPGVDGPVDGRHYLGATGAGLALATAIWAGAVPQALVSGAQIAAVTMAVVTALALAQLCRTTDRCRLSRG